MCQVIDVTQQAIGFDIREAHPNDPGRFVFLSLPMGERCKARIHQGGGAQFSIDVVADNSEQLAETMAEHGYIVVPLFSDGRRENNVNPRWVQTLAVCRRQNNGVMWFIENHPVARLQGPQRQGFRKGNLADAMQLFEANSLSLNLTGCDNLWQNAGEHINGNPNARRLTVRLDFLTSEEVLEGAHPTPNIPVSGVIVRPS